MYSIGSNTTPMDTNKTCSHWSMVGSWYYAGTQSYVWLFELKMSGLTDLIWGECWKPRQRRLRLGSGKIGICCVGSILLNLILYMIPDIDYSNSYTQNSTTATIIALWPFSVQKLLVLLTQISPRQPKARANRNFTVLRFADPDVLHREGVVGQYLVGSEPKGSVGNCTLRCEYPTFVGKCLRRRDLRYILILTALHYLWRDLQPLRNADWTIALGQKDGGELDNKHIESC